MRTGQQLRHVEGTCESVMTGKEQITIRMCQQPPSSAATEAEHDGQAHLIMARMSALLGYVCTVSWATWNGVNTRRHAVSMNCGATRT